MREVDRYRPIYYAAVSGDFNPIHIDREVGRVAQVGGAGVGQPGHRAHPLEDGVGEAGGPARVKRLRVRFSRPVVVGDVVTFRGRCVAVEGPVVRLEVEARNQRGEEVLKGASAEGWLETV